MDLSKLSLIEIKAMAWDLEYNLRIVNNELNKRLSELKPEVVEVKKEK